MIRTGEPNDYAAEIMFYLPLASDPLSPKTGHVFVLGEVQIKLHEGDPTWTNVPLAQIVERGGGWYAIRTTAGQRAAATVIAYQAVCADAQPDRGTEVVGDLSGDIAENGTGVLTIYLPDQDDPVYGTPIDGHVFMTGEVQIGLPNDALGNVDPATILPRGGGLYDVPLDATQTTKRGKVIVIAEVAGAQRFSAYRMILGVGALVPPAPPPLPVPGASSGSSADSTASGDLRLIWSNATADADIALIDLDADVDVDLATDRGLVTALILSWFVDRRAEDDDVPPSGDPRDRRGWWADEFSDVEGDRIGSRMWLLDRSTLTNETVMRAKEYLLEASAWMIEDKVASTININVDRMPSGLLITGALQRPGRDAVTFRFAHVWDHLQETT